MTRLAVLDDWQGVARHSADWSEVAAKAEIVFFEEAFADEDAAVAALADFDVLLTMRERMPMPRSLIVRLPKLAMVGITLKANAALDIDACTEQGILVCYTDGYGGADYATAELALGLLIAAARGIPTGDANIKAGRFQHGVPTGIGLAGKTLGIIGLGRQGSRMARYAEALDMNVLAWSENLTSEKAAGEGAELVSKQQLLERSDAISLHVVMSPRSRGIIGAEDIARMKPGAILVNTSRGPLVDEAALIAAVQEGRITAALDVFDREPLPADHKLRSVPHTVLTPHLGYGVAETWASFYPQSVENAVAFIAGRPIRVLNPEAVGNQEQPAQG